VEVARAIVIRDSHQTIIANQSFGCKLDLATILEVDIVK